MKNNKQLISYVQMVLLFVAIFAFSYIIGETNELYEGLGESDSPFEDFLENYKEAISQPMFPLASASLAGCCEITNDGLDCVTGDNEDQCVGRFTPGVACENNVYCQRGCCYDDNTGIFNSNVLARNCPEEKEWVLDPFCNLPAAQKGCCVMGDISKYETYGQCQTDTQTYAIGDSDTIDWRQGMNELQCSLLSSIEKRGACVYEVDTCKVITEQECANSFGVFNPDLLCTSEDLNTTCEPTTNTACIDGRDQVFFVDSCGNTANIYDSSRIEREEYWNKILSPSESCNADNVAGSSDSKDCGNCFRTENYCGSAIKNGVEPTYGEYYCKPTTCEYKDKTYKNGESWCVYESAIGDGNDIPGSSHYQFVCSQGEIKIDKCADYRNEICIQTVHKVDGGSFTEASCSKNTARNCVSFNGQENFAELCNDEPYCEMKEFHIDGSFDFDYCAPEYPAGFSFEERYQDTATNTCGFATREATYMEVQKTWGGCECADNCDLDSSESRQKWIDDMENFCKSLGDCGFDVNIAGKTSDNYDAQEDGSSSEISSGLKSEIKGMSSPDGSYVGYDERMDKYLDAAGLLGSEPETIDPFDPQGALGGPLGTMAIGVGSAIVITETITSSLAPAGAGMAPFAGAAIGAAVGAYVGGYLAEMNGASPGWAMVAVVSGAIAGALIGLQIAGVAACGPFFWVCAVFVLIMIIASFLGGSCEEIKMEFTCEPWQPPVGSSDCSYCNEGDLPCSEYKCLSLGAGCELINKGTGEEACVGAADSGDFPRIEMSEHHNLFPDVDYGKTMTGIELTSVNGGCLDAYTAIPIFLTTHEPAQCKFDITENIAYSEMSYSLGSNAYTYDHNYAFSLPDPSHGQSQGIDVMGDMKIYVKCQDRFGHVTPSYYTVEFCVKEGQDVSPPRIVAMDPKSESYVPYDSTEFDATIITNELSSCRWDSNEFAPYSEMTNNFFCNDTLTTPSSPQGYTCTDTLPVTNGSNNYYIKCMDQPWLVGSVNESHRNPMTESQQFNVKKPNAKISIEATEPTGDVIVVTPQASVTLDVTTANGAQWHSCKYSFSGYETMIPFFETEFGAKHTQLFSLFPDRYKVYVECKDETGDFARSEANFNIVQETTPPQVTRTWQTGSTLYLVTDEDATCKYSETGCLFDFDQAPILSGNDIEHRLSAIRGRTYFVRCEDMLGNAPSGCSIILSAS